MIAALPPFDPPAIVQPLAPIEVKRRKRRGGSRTYAAPQPRRLPTWLVVGAIIMVTRSDGGQRPCHVVHVDHVRGIWYCSDGEAFQ